MKKSSFKLLSLLLALTFALAMLAGCGGKATDSADTSPGTSTGTSSGSTETSADAGTPSAEELEPYEITWYMLCNSISDSEPDIERELNKLVQPKINATVDIVMLDWGTWNERFNTSINAGEKIDIVFTADWWNYIDSVANGYFLPLNDPEDNLLEKYAPQTVADLGEGFVVGSQIAGVNYGVPTDKEFAVNGGIIWNKDLADKYNFDMSSVNSIADLQPMLQVIKENEPNIIPYLVDGGNSSYVIPFADLSGGVDIGINYMDLNDRTVKHVYEMPEKIELMKTHHEFYKLGYISPDAATDNAKYQEHLLAGDWFAAQQPLKPSKGKSTELMAAAGNKYNIDEKEFTPLVAVSLHAGGSMLAIPKTSEDPARAMMFIELMHTDPAVANLLVWGIEGVHHKVVQESDPKIVEPIPDNNWTSAVLPWTLGSVYIHWLGKGEDLDKHKNFAITKTEAPAHITLGYRFLRKADYQAEYAAINNALAEFSGALNVGVVEDFDAAYNKMMNDARAAGLDIVKKAIQEDLDQYLDSKK